MLGGAGVSSFMCLVCDKNQEGFGIDVIGSSVRGQIFLGLSSITNIKCRYSSR